MQRCSEGLHMAVWPHMEQLKHDVIPSPLKPGRQWQLELIHMAFMWHLGLHSIKVDSSTMNCCPNKPTGDLQTYLAITFESGLAFALFQMRDTICVPVTHGTIHAIVDPIASQGLIASAFPIHTSSLGITLWAYYRYSSITFEHI